MTSKATRSDATSRQIFHHPVQALKEKIGGQHDKQGQQEEDRREAKSGAHLPDGQGPQSDGPSSKGESTADRAEQSASGPSSKAHVNDPDHTRAEDVANDFLGRSEEYRTVRDPVTHDLLQNVRDVTKDEYKSGLGEATQVDAELRHPGQTQSEKQQDQGRWAGMSALPAFPYKQSSVVRPRQELLMQRSAARFNRIVYALLFCWMLAVAPFVPLHILAGLTALGAATMPIVGHLMQRRLHDAFADLDAEAEEERGEKIGASHWPESAEWANRVLAEIWPAIQPEMFDSLRDTLEDLLQANVPSFLSEVKVADFTQGANPLRILSVSLLPDTKWKSEKSSESGDEGKHEESLKSELHQAEQEAHKEADPEDEMMQEEHDPNNRYVNLSVTFAYRGKNHRNSRKERHFGMAEDVQMLLLLVAKLGPVALRLPVKVHLQGLVGTVRIRVHLIASPPFLGQTLISFTSLPRVKLDVVPLQAISLNDIKPLANFVQRAIDSAFASITAPKSIGLDLASLISSDGVQREINAVGVVVVTLSHVEGLERADIIGLSDPYALFLWNRSGKPMFSTRVILQELNPRFNESMAILVPQEIVKAKECIGVEIYDSDRGTDGLLGKMEMELSELFDRPGELIKRTEQLMGPRPGATRPGKATWSACFLPKATSRTAAEQSQTKNEGREDSESKPRELDTEQSKSFHARPPSPALPSGILSVQIHEIAALSNKSSLNAPSSTSRFSRNTAEGRVLPDEDTTDDLADEAPSSYVEVIAEDRLVFRTRTKISDYRPIFNAGTEKVILNWQTARVLLVIREKKFDEADPILGLVALPLRKLFQHQSLASAWHPISGGIGSGRIKVSLLFQSVQLPRQDRNTLPAPGSELSVAPPQISPSSIGVIHIKELKLRSDDSNGDIIRKWSKHSLTIRTLSTRSRISSKYCHLSEESGQPLVLDYNKQLQKRPALIPTFRRGASPLMLRLDTKDSLGRTRIDAMAVFWLRNVHEHQDVTLELPIWKPNNKTAVKWLRQQYADHHKYYDGEFSHDQIAPQSLEATVVGTAKVVLSFLPGVNSLHGRIKDPSGGLATVCQAWKLAVCKGVVHEDWPTSHESMKDSEAGQRSSSHDDCFYDANSSSSSEDESDSGQGKPAKSNRSRREQAAQGKSRSVQDIASSSLERVVSRASHRDGMSSGSKADIVRRLGRDISERQPIPFHLLDDSKRGNDEQAASGDVKPVRVLDSAVGALKDRSQSLAYSFDRKKGQKGGEGVEVEV